MLALLAPPLGRIPLVVIMCILGQYDLTGQPK
jgi:hypothetical protein